MNNIIVDYEGSKHRMTSDKHKRHQQMMWRRSQTLDLASRGYTHMDIAKILQVDRSVISRDIAYLNHQSKANIQKYIDEKLPSEYEKCIIGLTTILNEMWLMSYQRDIDRREKIQALSLAKECYSMKLELLTNATVIGDAVRFVTSHQQQQQQKKNQDQQSSSSSLSTEEEVEEEEEEDVVEEHEDLDDVEVATTEERTIDDRVF